MPQAIVTDPDTDIAVMTLSATDLTAARIGDSRHVEIGDFVLAVGSPFGLSQSITLGIISAKGRRDLKLGDDALRYQDFLQTDAAINPGNSGGPLVNLRGEVIGMNTAIASTSGVNEGIGFGIPINMVMFVARQLIDHGTVRRAKMGVSLDREFTADAARAAGLSRLQGARVTAVEASSPAESAGLVIGDIVLEFDGVAVESDVHLVNLVSITPIGQEVSLAVHRKGRRVRVMCTLVERPNLGLRITDPAEQRDEVRPAVNDAVVWELGLLGVHVVDVTGEVAKQLNLSRTRTGCSWPGSIRPGRWPATCYRGDVIDRIDQQSVQTVQEAQRFLAQFLVWGNPPARRARRSRPPRSAHCRRAAGRSVPLGLRRGSGNPGLTDQVVEIEPKRAQQQERHREQEEDAPEEAAHQVTAAGAAGQRLLARRAGCGRLHPGQ